MTPWIGDVLIGEPPVSLKRRRELHPLAVETRVLIVHKCTSCQGNFVHALILRRRHGSRQHMTYARMVFYFPVRVSNFRV